MILNLGARVFFGCAPSPHTKKEGAGHTCSLILHQAVEKPCSMILLLLIPCYPAPEESEDQLERPHLRKSWRRLVPDQSQPRFADRFRLCRRRNDRRSGRLGRHKAGPELIGGRRCRSPAGSGSSSRSSSGFSLCFLGSSWNILWQDRGEHTSPCGFSLYFLHLFHIGLTRCFVRSQFGKKMVNCGNKR